MPQGYNHNVLLDIIKGDEKKGEIIDIQVGPVATTDGVFDYLSINCRNKGKIKNFHFKLDEYELRRYRDSQIKKCFN